MQLIPGNSLRKALRALQGFSDEAPAEKVWGPLRGKELRSVEIHNPNDNYGAGGRI